MFDKQSIEAYRNIKAPEELREKVMRLNPELSSPGSNHRSKNAMLRPIAAVACAAVFCLAVSFSFGIKRMLRFCIKGYLLKANQL